MKAFPLLLGLLVLLTPVDDAMALATPETDDDALAAQNNHYLSMAAGQPTVLQHDQAPLPPTDQSRAAAQATPPRPWVRQAGSLLATLSGPELRYVFMSLLR
jgi:hypothetical protein